MKRYVRYLLVLVIGLALWGAALRDLDALAAALAPPLARLAAAAAAEGGGLPVAALSLTQLRAGLGVAVPAMPLYLLVVLGCYCLARLGSDLLAFRDDPAEIAKLEQVSEGAMMM